MPYTRQTAFGWSHELMASSVVTVDYVRNEGRDLNTRPRLNTRPSVTAATRRLAFLGPAAERRSARARRVSCGQSEYHRR